MIKKFSYRVLYAIGGLILGYFGYLLFSVIAESANQSVNTPHIFRSMGDDSSIFVLVLSIMMMLGGWLFAIPAAFLGAFDKE